MSKIFEISREDKENFIEALHAILNLDRNYSNEEREFIYHLKILMEVDAFRPYSLDNEEEDLVKIIMDINNKDLIYYLFLMAVEVEKKQLDKSLYKTKMKNIVEKLNSEIQEYIDPKYSEKYDKKSSEIEKQLEKITRQGQEVIQKSFLNKFFNRGKK